MGNMRQALYIVVLSTAYATTCHDKSKCVVDNTQDDCAILCDCTQTEVNCNKNGKCQIWRIPILGNTSLYETVTRLDMSKCQNLSLSETSFMHYKKLTELVLYDCWLNSSVIPDETFSSLTGLEFLDISHNELFPFNGKTRTELFRNLSSLRELRAYGNTGTYNRGSGYADQVFATLPSLKTLWIDGFDANFSTTFQNLTNLEELRISGDMIDPPWRSQEFCEIKDLTYNSLKNLSHIKRLSILKCGIERVKPDAFKDLIKLEYLDLSENTCANFESISRSLRSLSKTVIEVVLNHIQDTSQVTCGINLTKTMAEDIQNLSITTLRLQHNTINSIKKYAFAKLPPTLTYVDLGRNNFEAGMYLFYLAKMPNLKVLNLSYNFFGDEYNVWRQEAKTYTFSDKYLEKKQVIRHEALKNQAVEGFLQTLSHHLSKTKCPKTNFNFPPGTITVYLPHKLEILHINNSKLGFPIIEFFFDANNSLKEVDASHSMLYCWEGPLHGLTNITNADLSHNGCSYASKRFFTGFPKMETLKLNNNLLGTVVQDDTYGELFLKNENLRCLNLSFNHIQYVPPKFLQHQSLLRKLDLSDNGIRTFELNVNHMSHLQTLDLRNNHIEELNENIRDQLQEIGSKNKLIVQLQGNQIECSCSKVDFLRWVLEIMDTEKLLIILLDTCSNSTGAHNVSTFSELNHVVEELEKTCAKSTYLIIVVGMLCVILFNIIFAIIVHKFRWKIRYWYYVAWSNNQVTARNGYALLTNDTRYKYNVYVGSVSDDMPFVMENLKPKLSNKYKLFIQEDDILPGQNMYSIIANALHVSHVAVFVISKECEEDPHWHIAIKFAEEEALRRGQPMFLCIFLDSENKFRRCRMFDVMTDAPAIDFPANSIGREEAVFWQECVNMIEEIRNRQVFSL